MKIVKQGVKLSDKEIEKQKKDRAAALVKEWSLECSCEKCGTIFTIDINDLARYDDVFGHISYFVFCPVCETPYKIENSTYDIKASEYIAQLTSDNRKKFKKLLKKHEADIKYYRVETAKARIGKP
ncbi:hypothetical protein SDC9_181300 [bioreactor metagenome]|uniref:CpXC domain-containing protein n=1 Tax=bioreactor metagenome TaxID=1076179 RepID=A0A645H460_9ZZZZ